ncbi:MAG: hypothetical protein AAGB48_11595 [Planctomycetota bacterium]
MPTDAHQPTSTTSAAHPTAEPGLDTEGFDDLAELFLGDQPDPVFDEQRRPPSSRAAAARPQPDRRSEVRALIVGHLPIAASAWVAQHARDLSAELRAPVAVLSFSSGRVGVAVHGRPATSEALGHADALGDAIESAHRAGVAAWLIRTDALTEIALAEQAFTPGEPIDGITLLTGADEAAMVNAYRAIKALTATAPGLEPDEAQLHLAVMGSEEPTGREAAERLRKAASSFLDTGLASVVITEKIGTGTSARLYDGEADRPLGRIIADLPRTVVKISEIAPEHPHRRKPTPGLRLSHGDNANASRIGPDLAALREDPATPAESPAREPSASPIASVRRQAATAAAVSAVELASGGNRDESSHGSLAVLLGLTPIEARCPYADEVELAADPEGRAHLIVHAPGAAHTLPSALESLEIAGAWLEAHLPLIAAASQGAVIASPPREPAAHLVVDHAASVRRLLDTGTNIYVLAAGQSETLCVPLN